MYSVFVFIAILSITFASKQIMKYNTRYSISKPHYLSITGPLHSNPKDIPRADFSYEIPKESYKKVFTQNIPYKKRQ